MQQKKFVGNISIMSLPTSNSQKIYDLKKFFEPHVEIKSCYEAGK